MNKLTRRLNRLEADLPAPPDAPAAQTWMTTLETIVGALSGAYQQVVVNDLTMLAEQQPETLTDAWYRNGLRRLTVMLLEMVEYAEAGLYVGRLVMPDAVAATMCATYESADKRPVGRSGDYHLWNHRAADTCPQCGWCWWSPRLRDELQACPGCDQPLDLYLTSYDLDCLRPLSPYIQILDGKRQAVRAEVWGRAVRRYGVAGAEMFLDQVEVS